MRQCGRRIFGSLLCLMIIGMLSMMTRAADASDSQVDQEEKATYTVTYKPGEGSGDDIQVPAYSTSFTLDCVPNTFSSPDGTKDFAGWSVGGETKLPGDTIILSADTTVTALWSENVTHVHYWTYRLTDDTIWAICRGVGMCGIISSPSLSIHKPTLTVEGGTGDAEATVGGYQWTTADGLPDPDSLTIYYYDTSDDSSLGTTAPTTAGSYRAEVTVGGATASTTYTIAPRPTYKVTYKPGVGYSGADVIKFGQSSPHTLIKLTEVASAGGWTSETTKQFLGWSVDGTLYQPDAALTISGDMVATAMWVDTDIGEIGLNSFFVDGKDIVFDQDNTIEGTSGTAVLSVDSDNNPVLTLNNFTGSFVNDGSSDISADIDYYTSQTKPLTIVLIGTNSVTATEEGGGSTFGIYVGKTVTITGTGSLTSTGAGAGIFISGSESNLIIDADVTAIDDGIAADGPCGTLCSQELIVTSKGKLTSTGMCAGVIAENVTVENAGLLIAEKTVDIEHATAVLSFDSLTLKVNDNIILAGESEDAASVINADNLAELDDAGYPKNTYSYVRIGMLSGLEVSLKDETYEYDGTDKAFKNSPTANASTGTTTITYSFEKDGTYVEDLGSLTKTKAGEYTVYIRATNPCYSNIATTTATLKITQKALTITAGSDSKAYDGTDLTKDSYTCEGLVSGDKIESVTITGSQTNAGSSKNVPDDAKVVNSDGDVTDCYDITYEKGTLTIIPAKATITITSASKTEGEADPVYTGTVEGLASEGDLGKIAYKRTNSDEAPGTYKGVITATYTANANYDVTVKNGDFTISEKTKGEYKAVSGVGSEYTKGSDKSLTFVFKRLEDDASTFSHFRGIEVDGKAVPERDASGKANWKARSGSLILELQPSYLETLPVGEHLIKIIFDDGESSAVVKVIEAVTTPAPDTTPVTGDTANPLLWAAIVLLSLAGLAVMIEKRRSNTAA